MMRLSEHFTLEEFTFSQTAERLGIDNTPTAEDITRMMTLCEKVLEPLREELGRPIIITSGYRSPELNAVIGGSIRSQHQKGEAADIVVPGFAALAVCKAIRDLDRIHYDQIIHEFGRWTHVSYVDGTRNRNENLTMYRSADGRTITVTGLQGI